MLLTRGILVWVLIILVETGLGAARVAFVEPVMGELAARRAAIPVSLAVIALIAIATGRFLGRGTAAAFLAVGVVWAGLTLGFEVVLGRFAFGFEWERIFLEYDPGRGGYMGFALAAMALLPLLAAAVSGRLTRR